MSCKYLCRAATGHVDVSVEPIVTVQLLRKGSVLDALMTRCAVFEERVRSLWQSVSEGSKELVYGEQNLLARRKP